MKRFTKTLLTIFILMLPFFVKAETYNSAASKAGNYMNTSDYRKSLVVLYKLGLPMLSDLPQALINP